MEANFFAYSSLRPTLTSVNCRKLMMIKHKPKHPSVVVSVQTRPSSDDIAAERQTKCAYKDNCFDLLAINHLSKCVQEVTGLRNGKSGYESLVEVATLTSQKFNPIMQRELIIQALNRALPKPIFSFIKTVLPPCKFSRESFAAFTVWFFPWLVGPCEVRESEVNGRREKSSVHIRKCRFLEETNCVGMCVNLCKIPTQSVIKDSMGMPLKMVPNFEDMSCEMIFGQDPPASTDDDPALKQPCYKLCKAKKKHGTNCLN